MSDKIIQPEDVGFSIECARPTMVERGEGAMMPFIKWRVAVEALKKGCRHVSPHLLRALNRRSGMDALAVLQAMRSRMAGDLSAFLEILTGIKRERKRQRSEGCARFSRRLGNDLRRRKPTADILEAMEINSHLRNDWVPVMAGMA